MGKKATKRKQRERQQLEAMQAERLVLRRALKLQAGYDAAETTDDNYRHWAKADGLSADAATSPERRRTLRNRARYEVANNSYARGIVLTLANDTIGTGPRLQVLTEASEANQKVERAFAAWAEEVRLAQKLRIMRVARAQDGEAFGVLVTNDKLTGPVQLDMRLIEADQVTTPDLGFDQRNRIDGIVFDELGKPVEYHVLEEHPGDTRLSFGDQYERIPAQSVIHWFRADRPGQHRGLPDIMPALPLFAQLRRYTLAVIAAAETAADFAAVIQSNQPPNEYDDSGSPRPEPMDVFELEKRMATVLPDGYQLGQVKAEQPATTYAEFKREILNEIARCLNMPFNVAAANSSEYNYASGRLDHQIYFKSIDVERTDINLVILDHIFDAWLREYLSATSGISPSDIGTSDYRRQWFWPGREHVDPVKEANAQKTRLANHTTTLASEYAREGRDWEAELRQRAKEKELMRELGLAATEAAPPAQQDGKQQDAIAAAQLAAEAVPAELILTVDSRIDLKAGEGEDARKPRRFEVLAYTGGELRVPGFRHPVIPDLDGLKVASESLPILKDHRQSQIVGHTESVRIDRKTYQITVAGMISGTGPAAEEVAANSDNGFPWQASIGASIEKIVYVRPRDSVVVNGRTFLGPVLIARRATLREVSFVAIGADADTSATIAASVAQTIEVTDMNYEKWLEAKGFDPETLSDEQKAVLKAAYDAEQATGGDGIEEEGDADTSNPIVNAAGAAGATDASSGTNGDGTPPADLMAQFRSDMATETERVNAIRQFCAGHHNDIEAQAIREGWDANRTELAIYRASRPSGPAIHSRGGQRANARVLEAAVRLGGQESEDSLLTAYGEQTMEAAHPLRRIGIRQLIEACCQLDGAQHPGIAASVTDLTAAGFSTISLPGILSNTAKKTMLGAYNAVPGVARMLARKLSTNDFKTHTGYRLTGDMKLEKVGADGELKHGKVGEQSYTYAVDTYGKIFGLTRQMIKNDDLGAFLEIPRMIGRGAALRVEDIFWTLVLANTGDFFHADNNNYIEGATTVLDSTGLGLAVEKLMKQTDPDGNPILLYGKYLAIPPELKIDADELYVSTNINTGGASTKTKVPNRNIWAGKYEPVAVPYLSNSGYTGYSTTAWYLWGDPADVAAFGIAFLDGVETPVIEDAPLPSDILGKAWRGYLDVGVCQIDPRGAVKSKGAA